MVTYERDPVTPAICASELPGSVSHSMHIAQTDQQTIDAHARGNFFMSWHICAWLPWQKRVQVVLPVLCRPKQQLWRPDSQRSLLVPDKADASGQIWCGQGPPPPSPMVVERFSQVISQLFQQVHLIVVSMRLSISTYGGSTQCWTMQ